MKKTATLQDIINWKKAGKAPEWAGDFLKREQLWDFKRNPEAVPIVDYDELHDYAKNYAEKFTKHFPEGDLHITGSWVNNTFSHPEVNPEYAKLRKDLGKTEISDLDFWTSITPREEARKKLWKLAEEEGIKVDWVEWWGPAICIDTKEFRACNKENRFAGVFKKKLKSYFGID